MPGTAAGGGSGGFALTLLTESFAVRALLGSMAAAVLAALVVRQGLVSGSNGRRLLVLTPALAAAAAAVASALGSAAFLPELRLIPASTARSLTDSILDLTAGQSRNLLLVAYAAIAGVLLGRRAVGLLSLRRLVARGCEPGAGDRRVVAAVERLAPRMELAVPRLVLVRRCPGGAFAAGLFRPLVAVDPALAAALDDRELEGLLAHELAHLRRRDPLLRLVVGAFRDVTFFLPAVSLAARWLRREQEESADEVAVRATGRPAALASSILVVWQRAGAGMAPACSAVPPRPRLALANGGPSPVELRVERLLAGQRQLSRTRSNAELALAAAVLSVGVVAALTVPAWIVERTDGRDQLWVPILTGAAPAAGTQESPAFAAFRTGTATVAPDAAPAPISPSTPDACPCAESQAQLREGVGATAPTSARLRWSPAGEPDFEIRSAPRTLLELRLEQGPRVGVLLVEGSSHR